MKGLQSEQTENSTIVVEGIEFTDTKKIENYIQWEEDQGGVFWPLMPQKITKTIPSGRYTIGYNSNRGYFFKKTELNFNNLIVLPIQEVDDILSDIDKFWSQEEAFKQYGYIYKRGCILYGPAGNGKSSIIGLILKKLINEQKGIVIDITDAESLYDFKKAIPIFKIIEPSRKIIVLFEDIEKLLSHETELLNILDGTNSVSNVFYIATTNYPEQLKDRILNRPSRFDRRYFIDAPSYSVRKKYIESLIKDNDLSIKDIEKFTIDTEGMSLSHIKELVISVVLFGNVYEEGISRLKEMYNEISSYDFKDMKKKKTVGFNKRNI